MLLPYYKYRGLEAGCDEAGRGCLAGPVFAAAVILPKKFNHDILNDSKQLNENQRYELREYIENHAIAYAVAKSDPPAIDQYNILNASIRTMHKALDLLSLTPSRILVDGNRFIPYRDIEHHTIIKGDGIYMSIAAASILAKTYRDDYMKAMHLKWPHYQWEKNKGYPTAEHRDAIIQHGPCSCHRMTFQLYPLPQQGDLFADTID